MDCLAHLGRAQQGFLQAGPPGAGPGKRAAERGKGSRPGTRGIGNRARLRLFVRRSRARGRNFRRDGPVRVQFPSFAPDGKRFVFRSFEKDGYGLRIMDLESKRITTLTSEYDNFPLWSPRGDLIMFSRLVDSA